MNWSEYSRFVGDVFGAPLAMEGLAAFFLESTFLGLWWFGWDVLPARVHLLTVWAVALGATLSAAFIMAANSWMQHPVGYEINSETGRPELTSIGALFTNPVFVWGYTHVILASLVTGSLVMLSVSAWQIRRGKSPEVFVRSMKLALGVLLPVSILILLVGSQLGVIETKYQPMKVAAMEAQWDTCQPCSFSAAQIGGWTSSDQDATKIIEIPHLLSILATLKWDGKVVGINELQSQYEKKYGPGDYIPNLFIQYWSMRVMAYLGALLPILALWGCFLWWRRRSGVRPAVPLGRHLGVPRAVRDEHGRLAADRERPSAVGRPGPAADEGRELAVGQPDRGGPEPGHLLGPLRGARHRLGIPDAAVLEACARTRSRRVQAGRRS